MRTVQLGYPSVAVHDELRQIHALIGLALDRATQAVGYHNPDTDVLAGQDASLASHATAIHAELSDLAARLGVPS